MGILMHKFFIFIFTILLLSGCGETNGLMGTEGSQVVTKEEESSQQGSLEKTSDGTKSESIISEPASGELTVHFIDVGQGASTLIVGPKGETMLYDAGKIGGDAGDEVVSYIKELGLDKIDVVIATHPHSDHINGLDDVIRTFDVGSVYMPRVSHTTKTYENLLLSIKEAGLKVKEGKAGVKIPFGDVSVQVVSPSSNQYDNLNDWSVSIRVVYGDNSFIFTGDAEYVAEQEMVKSGYDLKSDVYTVGHHGSSTSSSEEFLDAVNPTYAIIQTGENSYGHPHREILERLKERNLKVYRTDLAGDIVMVSDGTEISVIKGKEEIGLPGSELYGDNSDTSGEAGTTHAHLSNVDGLKFIASINSEVYHEVGCPGGADLIKESNAIYFDTEKEAIDSGRRMCRSNLCMLN